MLALATAGKTALAGLRITPAEAERLLGVLATAYLLQRSAAGRYSCHDLLRLYAAQVAEAADDEPADERLFAWPPPCPS